MKALFVSHGAPTLLHDDVPARAFLQALPQRLPRPRAIVVVSAHHVRDPVTLGASASWQEWHDFGGFPDALYREHYRPPGDPALAAALARGLREQGFAAQLEEDGRLDHGAWVPLKLAWPAADVPVVTLALSAGLDSAGHLALGAALGRVLPDDVLLLASGSSTHNLREVFSHGMADPAEGYVREFNDWVIAASAEPLPGRLADWLQQAPHARRAHPSIEHFLPLLVARGAAGVQAGVEVWHDSVTFGVLGMHALAFAAAQDT
ncbi:dioxygenase family protein [Chitinilyticum litopenaei]|uniref:dioxygenase family protein n=1 Tax=Chitinilyticum litopenaei TaxID=1121276 RepID=UPI0005BC4E78|nr:class III extradiol ring-cleavage dioxygenase [Chitinilyticum litopenaei]